MDAYMEYLEKAGNLDKKALNRNIAESLRTTTDERFDEESSPEGKAWKRSLRGGKTLTRTGTLRNSIHARATQAGAEVGTNLIYAATHQFGANGRTIRAKKKPYLMFQSGGRWIRKKQVTVSIPARPYLGISPEDEAEISAIMQEALGE